MYYPKIKNNESKKYATRILNRIEKLSKISENKNDITRLYLSIEHVKTNKIVEKWMKSAGMKTWQDQVGNIYGRYEASTKKQPAILLGSHLDTVPNAGKYDGILGVLTSIEIINHLNKKKIHLKKAIEIVGFADEEGTRFGITLLGSKALTNKWKKKWLNYKDKNKITIAYAMENIGLNTNKIYLAKRKIKDIKAYIELHIEQGPYLYKNNSSMGVVSAINGAKRINCTFTGESGHAGTVPICMRKDPLIATSEWILFIENQLLKSKTKIVATIGKINCYPGATNVIPKKIKLTLDIRGPKNNELNKTISTILKKAQEISKKRSIIFNSKKYYSTKPIQCDKKIKNIIKKIITNIQGNCPSLTSGAGHDAISMAKKWPIGMIFIKCIKGISHSPKEKVLKKDIIKTIKAYMEIIYNLTEII
ncbi:allantoate amidohydrolase [Candidatus Purcelliella pentastirinorum]|uniref:Allantoate amidohydrolase n=1 Tax=Candidatus Purcelliella pentastirinorum TaxID=472834 RepID=A0AAX3N715_9ENTR|nr:allantoate amidohydrolase [Candidatus Purcelliella pentastirinorum]WDI78376.1 allantoate amidohydrolase [Candidatus Purcelliella pentastirinorum]WDR80597.1 allantoate amidohydrolase [Candidatus Purcelliella pentastirinorum]